MDHRTVDDAPVIGLKNAFVSPGSSGGGLFATPNGASASQTRLLGIIVNAAANNGGYAVGKYDTSAMWSVSDFDPTRFVSITAPAEGGTYDSGNVPNLVASAGTQTAQLRWESNVDGYLGTGGNVPISGRLSPGFQTITASVGGVASGTGILSKAMPLKTLHLTITGSTPAPSFIMKPPLAGTSGADIGESIPAAAVGASARP